MSRAPAVVAAAYPLAAIAAALAMQGLGHAPCHLCMMQRWPMAIAGWSGLVALAIGGRDRRGETLFVLLAALGILASGAIGVFHVGVEQHWWTYESSCTSQISAMGDDMLKRIMSADAVACDAPRWTLLGLSMAAMNAVASTSVGLALPLWQNRTINRIRSRGQTA